MVYPPFYYVNLYEVLAFCFLSILSAMYLCTVTFLLFFPSLFVTFSDVLVRFSLFPVPYSFMIKIYVLGGPYLLCLDFVLLFGGILSLCWRSVPPLLLFCIAVWGITLLCRWSVPPLLDFVLLFDVFIVSDNFCFVNANLHFYLLVFVIIGIFFIKSRKFQKFKKHIFRTPYSCLSVKAGGTRPLLP